MFHVLLIYLGFLFRLEPVLIVWVMHVIGFPLHGLELYLDSLSTFPVSSATVVFYVCSVNTCWQLIDSFRLQLWNNPVSAVGCLHPGRGTSGILPVWLLGIMRCSLCPDLVGHPIGFTYEQQFLAQGISNIWSRELSEVVFSSCLESWGRER